MAWLYALTLFASATLLFAVQPMAGRMLLPALGGSPAVWNTCLVFFQAVLLFGYFYAHVSSVRLGVRRQAAVHLVLILLPLLVLPITVDSSRAPGAEVPALWLLGTLAVAVGLPFFALATTAPMLQRWFAATESSSAKDPYFLYAASNAGSLVALLAYPFAVEPFLSLGDQSQVWRWGYVGFVALCLFCSVSVLASGRSASKRTEPVRAGSVSDGAGPVADAAGSDGNGKSAPVLPALTVPVEPESGGASPPVAESIVQPAHHPLRWLLLSSIPSSLLLGVTSYLTTDIAPIPLLWVIPLAIYLLTFIIAFSARIRLPGTLLGRVTAIGILSLTLALLIGATEPLWLVLPLHLVVFFAAALLCHGLLAQSRPPAERLTGFYLWLSLGGVLGGLFNALVAPILFHKLGNVEYPLLLVLVCLVRPATPATRAFRPRDAIAPFLLALAALGLLGAVQWSAAAQSGLRSLAEKTGLPPEMLRSALVFGLPLLAVYCFIDRPIRFAAGLGLLLLVGAFDPGAIGSTLYLERNFLGTVRVTRDPEGKFHRMVHGSTVHGQQRLGSPLPLTYYHPTGPAGVVFRRVVDTWGGPRRIGAVGLGTGSMAYFARPQHDWVFFELDPAVERVARDERFFTYLRDSRAASLRVVHGDARLRLTAEPDASFDVLVLDAFSSDAIPVHLLTAEVLDVYDTKLRDGGLLLFHVSNRYLDLAPVLAKLAETAGRPWVVRYANDISVSPDETEEGKYPSQWVLLARRPADLGVLEKSVLWRRIRAMSDTPRWTDAHANLLSAWKTSDE